MKARDIELADGTVIPILYEDRAVLVLDKPAGWLMVPTSWEKTARNLQLALESSINARDFWARSRNLKSLRFVHRLDAETSGAVLFVRSPGAMRAYSELFESRDVDKTYLAVVRGIPKESTWKCSFPIAPVPGAKSRMQAVQGGKPPAESKDAETLFRVLKTKTDTTLLEARPLTGRTHQIRVHLAAAGHAVIGDALYETPSVDTTPNRLKPGLRTHVVPALAGSASLALRAIGLVYRDPFTRKTVRITAPFAEFVRKYQFDLTQDELFHPENRPTKAQ